MRCGGLGSPLNTELYACPDSCQFPSFTDMARGHIYQLRRSRGEGQNGIFRNFLSMINHLLALWWKLLRELSVGFKVGSVILEVTKRSSALAGSPPVQSRRRKGDLWPNIQGCKFIKRELQPPKNSHAPHDTLNG